MLSARAAAVLAALCPGLAGVAGGCDGNTPEPAATTIVESALPSLERCDPARVWDPATQELEAAVLARINALRAEGSDCGARGSFEPAAALQPSGALRCAARLHSLDMLDRAFVDHENPDGETPWDRLRAVEVRFATADETIAAADLAPEDIVDALWMTRDGSCAALSAGAYTQVGVGVVVPSADGAEDDETEFENAPHWTVVVTKPLP